MPFRSLPVPLAPLAPHVARGVALALVLAGAAVAQTPGPTLDTRPARPERAFDDARLLYDGRLFGPAERAFGDFLDRYPRDARAPEALFLRAESALATDDAAVAASLFSQFQTRYPDHPLAAQARLALGRYYYARGDDARAEEALVAALAQDGPADGRAQAAYLLGLVHRRQGRAEAAAAAFEQAATDDTPTAPAALYALGSLRADAGDWAGAADAFGQLRSRYGGSPEDETAGLALAEALIRTGQLAEGADEAERRRPGLFGDEAARGALLSGEARLRLGQADAAQRALADVPTDSRFAQRAALARGRAASAESDWAEAATFYAAARAGSADRAEDDAIAHEAAYYQGLAYKQAGRLGDAEAALTAAASRRPDGEYVDPALLELGLLHYERRRYDEATRAFETLLQRNPRGPYAGEAARMMGEAYAASGDAARAQAAFRQAETLGTATAGTRAEVSFQDAYAIYQSGRYPEATPALLAVAAADPDGPRAGEALFWAGESAFQSGDYARSESILQDFLARFPGHGRADAARYVVAWTRYQRGDVQGAADGFERFLSAYAQTGELVPYYADALLRLGDLYNALGRYEDARRVYARVAPATPERAGGDYALFQTAAAYGQEGQTAQAIQTYDRLLIEYPQSERYAQALLAQGALYSAQGADDQAIEAYERVLRERPDAGAAALLGIGDVLINQTRYALAEAAYRRVLEQYPGSTLTADAFSGLADALAAQGRGAEIDDVYRQLDAGLADDAGRARLSFARAQLALASGQDSVAVGALEAVLARRPPADVEQEALLSVAGAYASAGRRDDGVRALRLLLSRYPDSPTAPEAQLQLAETLLAGGDAEAARQNAAGLADRFPANPERAADALALEALALQDLGRTAEADDRLRTLLGRFPDTAAAQAARSDRPDLAPTPPAPGRDDQ